MMININHTQMVVMRNVFTHLGNRHECQSGQYPARVARSKRDDDSNGDKEGQYIKVGRWGARGIIIQVGDILSEQVASKHTFLRSALLQKPKCATLRRASTSTVGLASSVSRKACSC